MCAMLKIITELKLVLLIALLHLFLTSVLYAQTLSAVNSFTTSLKGKVVDSATHIALSHVTVLVQEPGKDQPFKNTRNSIKIKNLEQGVYLLKLDNSTLKFIVK